MFHHNPQLWRGEQPLQSNLKPCNKQSTAISCTEAHLKSQITVIALSVLKFGQLHSHSRVSISLPPLRKEEKGPWE